MAADEIHGWLSSPEMKALIAFAESDPIGTKAFRSIVQDTSSAFPELVRELEGLAEGSGAALDSIWVANLIAELDPLLPPSQSSASNQGHCTDIYAHADANPEYPIHGHNEDWSVDAKEFWYYVSLTPDPDSEQEADFSACAGLTYPGSMLAYAPAWNAHGIYQTQNTLFPNNTRSDGGLACSFVQRAALCSESTTSLDAYLAKLHTGGWASGASLNVVDLGTGEMANAEVLLDAFDVVKVKSTGNYSHTNEFKHLVEGILVDLGEDSATHRQARLDELPPPESLQDIADRLGDTSDTELPLYRDTTLTSSLLDVASGALQIWDGRNPKEGDPDFVWNIKEWFGST